MESILESIDLVITILFCLIIFPGSIFMAYMVMVVTPRVDKYNGYPVTKSFAINNYQAIKYLLTFYPGSFLKATKGYVKFKKNYLIENRDLKLFKIYNFFLNAAGIIFLLSFILSYLLNM